MRVPGRSRLLLLVVPALCLAYAACESAKTTTTTGPTPVRCQVTPSYSGGIVAAGGGSGAVNVTTAAECAWNASANVGWITNINPSSGQGPADVSFQVASNPTPAARQGQISINGATVNVSQSGIACEMSIDPTSATVSAAPTAGNIAVTAPAGCTWSVASNAAWLVITSETTGSGSGQVRYSAQANTGAARFGVINIGGLAFVLTQQAPAGPACNNTIQPTSAQLAPSGGTVNVTVQADPPCAWIAVSNVPWMAVVGVGSGTGNGSVTVSASANTGATRVGTATIAGQTLTVTQTGSCLASISPLSQSSPIAGGAATPVTVTVATGCAWTATTAAGWITITEGASGSGNGTVRFSVGANPGGPRSGTLTIAGQTHTVNQAGSCTAAINPTSQSVGAAAGPGAPVAVNIPDGCSWTATTSDAWIALTGTPGGTGNGTVTFTVAANAGPARTGTISIGGQVHTVNQAAGCTASIDPTGQTVPAAGGDGTPVAVTTAAGCAWTASASDGFLKITGGASGTGNGTVTFTVSANTGPQRTGTLTIAGQTHTVTQQSGCTYTIKPLSMTLDEDAQTSPNINVTTAGGCTWTAVPNDPWITIESGASGSGNGTVKFRVTANAGDDRVGTITIAGLTFTVTQQGDDE
jgi:hypothetical protein